jgi:acyl-CoA reductase-like NAD-dependent aldehyde dehydrogenase
VLAAQVAGGLLHEVNEIGVRVQAGDSGIFQRMTQVRAPWDGEVIGEVGLFDATRAERAIVNAEKAFAAVRAMPSHARRDALRKIARALDERREELAKKLAIEAGKPIVFARGEVGRAVSTFEIASEEATRMSGEIMSLDVTAAGEGHVGAWRRVPRGPIVAIAPFNFPLNLVAHKVAPALACGASIVLKPAPQTPLIALELEAIVRASGFPEHAFQVVPCDVPVAELLVRDDRFATLSFTGSAAVGWHLKSIAGKKHVLLELGGNAAAIVHDDADLDFAAQRVTQAAFGYAGQVCIKVQRLYVHEPVASAFVDRVVAAAGALAPRPPLEDGILSCLIDQKSAVRIGAWVDEGKQRGARALVSAERDKNKLGAIVLAFDGDGRGTKVVDEEVFGPVLTVHRYARFEDALAMADATRYGLQAGLFTDSRARVAQAFERMHVGGLIVGDAPSFRVDSMPYGGTRDSGIGREGVRFAIEEMTEHKLLVIRQQASS